VKPAPAMWTAPEGLPEIATAREVSVIATLRLPCRAFAETVRTAEPGRLSRVDRHVLRLAAELPAWVSDLNTSPVDYRGDTRAEALEVTHAGAFAVLSTNPNGGLPNRQALDSWELWQRFRTFGGEFTPEQRRDFAAHPLAATALRTAALLVARRHLDAFKSALDRGRWLHTLAQAGTLKGWGPEVLASGPEGFLEALTAELDALPGHKAPALLERLGVQAS